MPAVQRELDIPFRCSAPTRLIREPSLSPAAKDILRSLKQRSTSQLRPDTQAEIFKLEAMIAWDARQVAAQASALQAQAQRNAERQAAERSVVEAQAEKYREVRRDAKNAMRYAKKRKIAEEAREDKRVKVLMGEVRDMTIKYYEPIADSKDMLEDPFEGLSFGLGGEE